MPPVVEILLIQWTSSVALYGYFRRALTPAESVFFGVVTVVGYWAMITEALYSTFVFLGATAAVMLGVGLRRPHPVAATK